MKPDQQFTPKYWVGHDSRTDDIIPETLSKRYDFADIFLENAVGYWQENDRYEIILVEIKRVEI